MNKKIKIAFILNCIIFLFVLFSVFSIIINFQFMTDDVTMSGGIIMLRYYTIDSNILMGISALFGAYWELLYLKGKVKELPKLIYIIKLLGTVGVTITLLVVIFFLYPTSKNAVMCFCNSNLFMHVLTPILSIICFIFFENTNNLKIKEKLIGVSSLFVYSIFYGINVIAHSNNGIVTSEYDFYGFLFGKLLNAIFVIPLMYIFAFGVTCLLVFLNKLIYQKNNKN